MIKIVDAAALSDGQLKRLLAKPAFDRVELPPGVRAGMKEIFGREMTAWQAVETIVDAVRAGGNTQALYYTKIIDKADLTEQTMEVTAAEFAGAEAAVDAGTLAALERAIDNIRRFHAEQMPKTWLTERAHGSLLGQKVTPLERVGLYVPGGLAAYPSSVIMNALPAQVAGVREIIMCVPPGRDGRINPCVLAAAGRAGVRRVFKIGGAQAVAAMAFGTETIPKVDKITGPGNIFVTLAKKAVYGHCDIDMLAGPSEILIIADAEAEPDWLAADMLSQAEHDPLASAVLLTDSPALADKVAASVDEQLAGLPRREIATEALDGQGLILLVKDIDTAVRAANLAAPEHLEIAVREPFRLLPHIKHAGAVFLGQYSPEALGDYFAGPNHVLPTGGTARFYSALNVETFMKKTSIIAYSEQALREAAPDVMRLAAAEGLDAHAGAIGVRLSRGKADGQ